MDNASAYRAEDRSRVLLLTNSYSGLLTEKHVSQKNLYDNTKNWIRKRLFNATGMHNNTIAKNEHRLQNHQDPYRQQVQQINSY